MGELAIVPKDIAAYHGAGMILAATDEDGDWHVVVMWNGKKCETVFMGPYAKDMTEEYIKTATNWLRKAEQKDEPCAFKYMNIDG